MFYYLCTRWLDPRSMRHPCEPSEYQFNYGRTYLRSGRRRGGGVEGGSGDSGGTSRRGTGSYSHPPRACRDSYPIPNRDLDLMFGVPEVNRPAEFLAKVKYDTVTGEVVAVEPVSGSVPVSSPRPSSAATTPRSPEMLEEKLVLNSFTRHGYNVEHLKGAITGPLPGMVTKDRRTGKHRHDPTRTTTSTHFSRPSPQQK